MSLVKCSQSVVKAYKCSKGEGKGVKKFREVAKCSGSIVECFQAAVDTDACLIFWEWGLRKSHCSCCYQRVWMSIYIGVGTDKQASLGVHAHCLAHAREREECDKM